MKKGKKERRCEMVVLMGAFDVIVNIPSGVSHLQVIYSHLFLGNHVTIQPDRYFILMVIVEPRMKCC